MIESVGRRPRWQPHCSMFARMFACESRTPFGRPVVPLL